MEKKDGGRLAPLCNNNLPRWVPFAGTKRKASMANIDDNFDRDCRPAPAKQFAVDAEVADEILQNGFYYDPSMPAFTENEVGPVDEEMEEVPELGLLDVQKGVGAGDRNVESCGNMKLQGLKECRDSFTHSLHESHSIYSTSSQSLPMNGLSLVLSDEIQATLARRRLNEDFILTQITDRVAQVNSKALVVWEPPAFGPLDLTFRGKVQQGMNKSCGKWISPLLDNNNSTNLSPVATCSIKDEATRVYDFEDVEMDSST